MEKPIESEIRKRIIAVRVVDRWGREEGSGVFVRTRTQGMRTLLGRGENTF